MPRPEAFHLLTPEHQEPLPESLNHWLKEQLPREYKEQVQFLRHEGILELLPEDPKDPEQRPATMGIIGIDGKGYPIPLPTDIERMLTKDKESAALYARKIEQGFTGLQLTPFGKPLAFLQELLRRSLLQHHKDGNLFSSDGQTKLNLNTNKPLYVLEDFANADTTTDPAKALVYYPTSFDPKNHGGKTKQQILDAGRDPEARVVAGWNTLLLEQDPRIPREQQGTITNGRKRLEANKTPNEYLALLTTPDYAYEPDYVYESGMTTEDWITRFLHELRARNRVLNDRDNPNDSLNHLLASYHPASGRVPSGYWYRDVRRACVGGFNPAEDRREGFGVCPAVRIGA